MVGPVTGQSKELLGAKQPPDIDANFVVVDGEFELSVGKKRFFKIVQ